MNPEPLSVNFVSSFPPRECGIATFTRDLATNISTVSNDVAWNVSVIQECNKLLLSNASLRPPAAALNKNKLAIREHFFSKTLNVIKDSNVKSYIAAAKRINDSKVDVVNIQHEFGLYKGKFGSYILEFMRRVRKPIVTTFHTMLPNPPAKMRVVVRDIYELSDRVVVSANIGIDLLRNAFQLNGEKAVLVPHGVPIVPKLVDTAYAKRHLGLSGKFVIASYGLINPDKGIEYVIEALPSIIEANPLNEIVYMIVGEFHPALSRNLRELYREKIIHLVKELDLGEHIVFVERYLSNKEMIKHFLATDVCAVINMNRHQVSSGILSQAIGCGRSIVATRFGHATEALSDGRGLFVEFGDPDDIAAKINLLIKDKELRNSVSQRAHAYGQSITWDHIARRYLGIFALVRQPQMPVRPIPTEQSLRPGNAY
ncbi:MAG: glycosyltransferase family 4 protein [Halobacteriota archaeon]